MAHPAYTAKPYLRSDGRWEWRITHRNGQIVATSGSQGYERVGDAEQTLIRFLAAAAAGDVVVEPPDSV